MSFIKCISSSTDISRMSFIKDRKWMQPASRDRPLDAGAVRHDLALAGRGLGQDSHTVALSERPGRPRRSVEICWLNRWSISSRSRTSLAFDIFFEWLELLRAATTRPR